MNIKDYLEELKLYVSKMSEELNNKVKTLDVNTNVKKANEIKNKATFVLTQAFNKVCEATNELSEEDVKKLIDHAIKKSRTLYSDACSKIENIANEVKSDIDIDFDYTKDISNNVEAKVGAFIDEVLENPNVSKAYEKAKQTVNETSKDIEEIGDKAIGTLKEWLNPENKE